MLSRIHTLDMYTSTATAQSFAERLHEKVNVPIYFYGAASPSNNMLRDIRKKLGYFRTSDKEDDFKADIIDESTNSLVSERCCHVDILYFNNCHYISFHNFWWCYVYLIINQ